MVFTPLDIFGFILTIGSLFLYFTIHVKFRPIKDRCDEIIVLVVFSFATVNIWLLLYEYRVHNDPWGDILGLAVYGGYFLMLGLIFPLSGLMHLLKKMPILNARRDKYIEQVKNSKKSPLLQDFLRKFMHQCGFLLIFSLSLLSSFVVTAAVPWTYDEFMLGFWEIRSDLLYFSLWDQPDLYQQIGTLHTPFFFFLYVGTIITIFLDWVRFSKRFWAIGRNTLIHFARKSELEGMPSFIPFFVGIIGWAVIFPPLPLYALMATVVFADTAASQIGIRYGKHKLRWNPKKSWEGLIAGSLVSLMAWIFVGPIWALGAMAGYILGDGLTEKPLKISDNLLTPMLIGLIFLILTLCGIPYSVPNWVVEYSLNAI